MLYQIRGNMDNQTKKIVINSFVLSHVIYALPFLLNCTTQSINKLDVAYKRCIKILFRYPVFFSSSQLFSRTSLPTLRDVIQQHSSLYCYKIFYFLVPDLLASQFVRTIRGNLILKAHKSLSLHNRLAELWNSLPCGCKQANTLHYFKSNYAHWASPS